MDIIQILTENLLAITLIIVSIVLSFIFVYIIRRIKAKTNRKKLLFEDFNIGKFKVIMYRRIGNKYHEIERVKLDIDTKEQTFKYRNKDFKTFSFDDLAFVDAHDNYYAFDFDTGEQLTFKTKGMPKCSEISIDDVDVYVNRGIIEQLVAGLEDLKPKGQWIMLIIGIALGIAIGIIIGIYLAPSIIHSAPTVTPTPTPTPTAPVAFVQNIMEKLK